MGLGRFRSVVFAACVSCLSVITTAALAKDAAPTTSGLPVPRYVSLKSDHVNVRAGPTKDNDVAWVYHSLLSGRRTAVITMKSRDDLASLYERADSTSSVTARLQAGVVAQVRQCASGWCRVAGNGFDGFIEQQRLWGVYADEKVN
jgi:SH3-like domain-containing protein